MKLIGNRNISNLLSKNNYWTYFVLSLIFLSIFYFSHQAHKNYHTKNREFLSVTHSVDNEVVKMDKAMIQIKNILKIHPLRIDYNKIDSVLSPNKLFCLIGNSDSLIYWNNSEIGPYAIDFVKDAVFTDCVKMPSGWFLIKRDTVHNLNVYIFDKIKSKYNLNNHLLKSDFDADYLASSNLSLSMDENNSEYIINKKDGSFLFGLNYGFVKDEEPHINLLVVALYFSWLIFLIIGVNGLLGAQKNRLRQFKKPLFILFIIILWVFQRLFMSSSDFAMWSSQSLALLVDSFLFLMLSIIITIQTSSDTKSQGVVTKVVERAFTSFYFIAAVYLIYRSSMILDEASFGGGLYFDMSAYSFLLSIIMVCAGSYLVITSVMDGKFGKRIPLILDVLISILVLALVYLIYPQPYIIFTLALFLIVMLDLIERFFWSHIHDGLVKKLLLTLILSGLSAILINLSLSSKTNAYQEHIANVLSTEKDADFENRFMDADSLISNDETIISVIKSDTAGDMIEKYLIQRYFSQNYSNYNIQVTLCDSGELIEIQPEKNIYNCNEYFGSLILNQASKTNCPSLYRFNDFSEGYYYIARFSLYDALNNSTLNLYIEFIYSHVPEGLGYPELLVDNKFLSLNLSGFSFARYNDDILVYKFGEYPYSSLDLNENVHGGGRFYTLNNHKHFITNTKSGRRLIVTREKTPFTIRVVIFSIIFILFSIISIIGYLITSAKKALDLFRMNFKTRLQTFVIATLTITFILIATSTLYFMQNNSREEMENQLREKTSSVLIELQHKLSSVSSLDGEDRVLLHQLLRKFSLVFFSDINLYDRSGKLVASSRPEIFDNGLLSEYINPGAYRAIFIEKQLNYITKENIGSLKYYSSYVPINLNSYDPIGIVSLPYFARQAEYNRSYYIMLSFLINIYVIVGVIGALMAIIISRYLTRPLVTLQESLAKIRIGSSNEHINWTSDDEIGLLISEYNLMVDKLEQSAELLVQSERESAWREVAKQIAHEIKNPLTPMKLNVQYLEKAFKDNDPNFAQKIKSVGESLISQIDTLNNVAEMFSDFARNSKHENQKTDLIKVIKSATLLFNKQDNLKIIVEYNKSEKFIVNGFEKDILRAINNIINNAAQATVGISSGIITISVSKSSRFTEVLINDNGKGIDTSLKSKIFQPYFTTRSSGTGLGLAIVKNIINEIGGEVGFDSGPNKGTTFRLKFINHGSK